VWTLAGRDFVCLEPWTARGNALSSGHNVLTVEPGQTRNIQLDLSFEPA
jgi:galactose mutarotase-like enzyme